MKLLIFAAFVIYLHLQMISASFVEPDCNYAGFLDQYGVVDAFHEALDKCFVFDLYHLSLKYELNEQFVYHSTDCSGEATYNRVASATSVKTDSTQTCDSWAMLMGYNVYKGTGDASGGNDIDYIVGLEIAKEGEDGERSTIVKNSPFQVHSAIFGDCFQYGDNVWAKRIGCRKENAADDVMTQELYDDANCKNKIEPGTWIYSHDSTTFGGKLEMTYNRDIREGQAEKTWRRVDTKAVVYEQIPYDIVCYEEEAMQKSSMNNDINEEAVLPEESMYINNDMHEPRAQNYGESMYNEPKPQPRVYDEPQYPLYNGPQASDYDSNWWTYLAVNVLVSIVCTLCVIGTCLTAYYYTRNKSDYSPVKWAKEEETDV